MSERSTEGSPVGPAQPTIDEVLGRRPNEVREEVVAALRAGNLEARNLAAQLWTLNHCQWRTFGELLPGLAHAGGAGPRLGVRSFNALARSGLHTWDRLTQATPSELSAIPNLGRKSLTEIAEAMLVAWTELPVVGPDADVSSSSRSGSPVAASEPEPSRGTPAAWAGEIGADLEAVLHWMWREAGAATMGEVIARWPETHPPTEISLAGKRLAAVALTDVLGVEAASEESWVALLEFPDTETEILRRRVLPSQQKATLRELGSDLRVSPEWVRKLEGVVIRTAVGRLDHGPAAPLRHVVTRLARQLGRVTEPARVRELVDRAVADTSRGPAGMHELRREMMLYLSGPHLWVGGLRWSAEGREALRVAERALGQLEPGGMVDSSIVDRLVARVGAPAALHDAMRNYLALKPLGDKLVLWTGSLADKAVGALAATGRPMTLLELHETVGLDRSPRSLAGQVQGDHRVRRRGRDRYGLNEWGGEEYSGILEELEQAVERAGGRVDLATLVERFVDEFGVSASSVRSYATDRRFVRGKDGSLSLRTGESPEVEYRRHPIEGSPGAFCLDGVWHARFEVDHDALRGSGRAVRQPIAVAAGLEPDLTLGFDFDGHTVIFSWAGTQPTVGSIRPLIRVHACGERDLLFLPLEGLEPRRCRVVRLSDRQREAGLARLVLEMGLEPSYDDAGRPLRAATALGLPAGADWEDITDRLRDRGEHDLIELLPAERR